MQGVNSSTGKALFGIEHLKQSIRDILNTPIGSRVVRRDYGSDIFNLIDAPMNRFTILDLYVASIDAILKWEPRFYPQRIQIFSASPGKIEFEFQGINVTDGQIILLDGIELEGATS